MTIAEAKARVLEILNNRLERIQQLKREGASSDEEVEQAEMAICEAMIRFDTTEKA